MLWARFARPYGGRENVGWCSSGCNMSFDAIAPHYCWMEFILAGEKLQLCRTRFLDDIPTARHILLLGEGHGRCLVECCRRFPDASISYVDVSARMLALATQRVKRCSSGVRRVEFIQVDALEWKPPARKFDLIITNFFFDCFRADQMQQIVSLVSAAATLETNWLIADFQTPPRGVKRIRAQLILRMMYAFFRAATQLPAKQLTPPDSFLMSAGFTLHRRIKAEWDLLHCDWWQRAQKL